MNSLRMNTGSHLGQVCAAAEADESDGNIPVPPHLTNLEIPSICNEQGKSG